MRHLYAALYAVAACGFALLTALLAALPFHGATHGAVGAAGRHVRRRDGWGSHPGPCPLHDQEGRPMSAHASPHPLAGRTVTINADLDGGETAEHEFRIEDWNDRVFGGSWMFMNAHPASLVYAARSGLARLPLDNEVVYGKVQGLGHLVHVSEIAGGDAV